MKSLLLVFLALSPMALCDDAKPPCEGGPPCERDEEAKPPRFFSKETWSEPVFATVLAGSLMMGTEDWLRTPQVLMACQSAPKSDAQLCMSGVYRFDRRIQMSREVSPRYLATLGPAMYAFHKMRRSGNKVVRALCWMPPAGAVASNFLLRR